MQLPSTTLVSFPRRREPSARGSAQKSLFEENWVPAFAGMTPREMGAVT